jgi:excisionase family DNA binding protein
MNHHPPRVQPAHRPPAGTRTEHLTIPEVCAELKVSRSTFYYWRQTGRAPRCVVLPNREVRITRAELEAWLRHHAEDKS